jgi:hypothetical protein
MFISTIVDQSTNRSTDVNNLLSEKQSAIIKYAGAILTLNSSSMTTVTQATIIMRRGCTLKTIPSGLRTANWCTKTSSNRGFSRSMRSLQAMITHPSLEPAYLRQASCSRTGFDPRGKVIWEDLQLENSNIRSDSASKYLVQLGPRISEYCFSL